MTPANGPDGHDESRIAAAVLAFDAALALLGRAPAAKRVYARWQEPEEKRGG